MKISKIIATLILVLVLPCFACAFDVGVSYKATFPNADDLSTTGGIELEASHEGYLVWMAYEKTMMRMIGQEMSNISLWSAGLGYRLKLLERLSIAVKGGFYKPIPSYRSTYQEAIYRQMHAYIEPVEGETWRKNGIDYDETTCDYEMNSGWGGEVSINWVIPFTTWLNLDLSAGYRYLNLKDRISANINGLYPGAYHEFIQNRNYCGGILGVEITFRF